MTDAAAHAAASKKAMFAAIGSALDATDGRTREYRIDAIYKAVNATTATFLPSAIAGAMTTPQTQAALAVHFAVPMLREVEDAIREDHDNPHTPEHDRPGLRRANSLVRGIRRSVEEGSAP